jgi:uncharacterized protein YciW
MARREGSWTTIRLCDNPGAGDEYHEQDSRRHGNQRLASHTPHMATSPLTPRPSAVDAAAEKVIAGIS